MLSPIWAMLTGHTFNKMTVIHGHSIRNTHHLMHSENTRKSLFVKIFLLCPIIYIKQVSHSYRHILKRNIHGVNRQCGIYRNLIQKTTAVLLAGQICHLVQQFDDRGNYPGYMLKALSRLYSYATYTVI